MQLTFLGAAKTVTGSKYLLEHEGSRLLVDCGLFQGLKALRLKNWAPLPVEASSLQAVLLTHAHLDHSGFLPLLVRQGFKGKVYCTPATERLCQILLPDSGRLQMEEANYANRRKFSKHHPAVPLYTVEDAEKCLSFLSPVPFHQTFEIPGNARASFFPVGHILGASGIRLEVGGKSIVFSGDLGRQDDLVMHPPEFVEQADYLVIESTYGSRVREPLSPVEQLESIINRTFRRGGTVIIPSFAVGRAQTLLYALHRLKETKRIPNIPVYLNSPMAIDATRVFCDFQTEHKLSIEDCQTFSSGVKYVSDPEASKALNERKDPMIIIASSGMATGGRILHHLKAFGPDARNTILFTGFQAAGTRGDTLVRGGKEVKIHGQMIPIQAEVVQIDSLSAHADQTEILTWLSGFKTPPKTTFVTHGEREASETLRSLIEEKLRWRVVVPELQQIESL